jgi:hypothetical protein
MRELCHSAQRAEQEIRVSTLKIDCNHFFILKLACFILIHRTKEGVLFFLLVSFCNDPRTGNHGIAARMEKRQ